MVLRCPWVTLLLVGSPSGVTESLGHLIAGGVPQWCYGTPGSPYTWWGPPVVLRNPWDTLLLVGFHSGVTESLGHLIAGGVPQ